MVIAGLTGGTGSGKSTAARRFESHGIAVVDADRIGHELIAPGGEAVDAVLEYFGPGVLTCGTIDRKKLGARVFADAGELEALNGIMGPRIASAIGKACAAHAEAGRPASIVDAALLGDQGRLEPWMTGLILVLCPEPIRVARLVASRGLSAEEARRRIRAQVPPESKRPIARWVIDNSGALPALERQVDAIANELLTLARSA